MMAGRVWVPVFVTVFVALTMLRFLIHVPRIEAHHATLEPESPPKVKEYFSLITNMGPYYVRGTSRRSRPLRMTGPRLKEQP